jgi:hypothetical protein
MMGVEHELLGHARVEVAVPLGRVAEADDGGIHRVGVPTPSRSLDVDAHVGTFPSPCRVRYACVSGR